MYWKRLSELQHEVDELFNALTGAMRPVREPLWRAARLFPPLNVGKTREGYQVTAELPGIKAEDLEIDVTGDTLTLKGERKSVSLNEKASYHRRERATGTFQRSVTLPARVDGENVKAVYKDGVLTVTLPFEKTTAPKQILIKAE